MKILLISPLPPPEGGIATWTVTYKDACPSHDISLEIINSALQGKRSQQHSAKRQILTEIKRSFDVISALIKKLRREKPDLLHLNTSCSRYGLLRDYLCFLMARLYRVPVLLHCHCNIHDQLTSKLSRSIFDCMVKKVSKVLVLNRQSCVYVNQIIPNKAEVLPNFVPSHGHKHIQINSVVQRVIFVGHVQFTKGVREIIRAAEQMPDITFSLVGPINDDVASMAVPTNVIFHGKRPHSEINDFLLASDVFLFPSYTEGFSIALAESMAVGLPAIATDVGANREMLEDQGGVIIPATDSNSIVQALNLLKSDFPRRTAMSAWNIEKVASCYSTNAVMDKLAEIYSDALSAYGPA